MRHIFIINPVSGKKDAALSLIPKIKKAADALSLHAEIVETKFSKHAKELAQLYAHSGEKVRLYAVGGDGTLNEVFSGAYPYKNADVACIPCGSGNDFIRNFGTREDFLDIPAQMLGTTQPIDLIQSQNGITLAITSTGLDAEVAYNIPKYRRIPLLGGSVAYNVSILEKLLRPLGKDLRIVLDGQETQGKYLIATVCNGGFYGGGYFAAPMAKMNDGLLDIILVKKISRLLIASIIKAYKNGQHYAEGAVLPKFENFITHRRAKEVIIQPAGKQEFILNEDGECGPAPRLYAKVMPLAGQFALPSNINLDKITTL